MDRIRVAALQYFIRPVERFDDFARQVTGLVETAADYKCRLAVFPEYLTVQLLTLGDIRRPIRQQVRALADNVPQYIDLFSTLARKHGLYIVGGSIPAVDAGEDPI